MSTISAEAVVRGHLAAFSSKDLPGMLATMAPNASFTTGTSLVDPRDFSDFFGAAMHDLDPTIRITKIVSDSTIVACEFVESVTVGDQRHHMNRAAFYRVEAALIVSAKVYDERD